MQIIPEHSIAIKPKGVDAAIYLYERGEKVFARAFKGKRKKPIFSYEFGSVAHRARFVEEKIAELIRDAKFSADRRAELDAKRAAELAQIVPGSILYSSWGYEQTNINFYQVLERKGAKTLVVREVMQERDHKYDMSGSCVAIPNSFRGEPIICQYGRGGAKVSDCQDAWLWDGRPLGYSSYA